VLQGRSGIAELSRAPASSTSTSGRRAYGDGGDRQGDDGIGAASGEGRHARGGGGSVFTVLEDINIAGAHGILVNVSAGMDLSIGEFQEVGQIVKQFASDDATVVIGTVIDPELDNQVRVTVVATGLGRPTAAVRSPLTSPASASASVRPGAAITARYAPSRRCAWCAAHSQQRLRGARQAHRPAATGGRGWVASAGRSEDLLDIRIPAAAGRLM